MGKQTMSDIEPADELASLLEDLHDSEINGETGWFFDRVWRAKIGDPWNGYVAEEEGCYRLLTLRNGCGRRRLSFTRTASSPRRTGSAIND